MSACQDISFELSKLKLRDFPVLNWDNRIARFIKIVNSKKKEKVENINLENELLRYLGYVEELISEIGMACIRQITAAVFLRPVIKSFAVLAAVLVTMVVAYLFYAKRMQFFALTPVFFGVYASLIFVEIGFWLHRETEEIIDFVERD